ncbi:MAG: cyclic dehypoxanthinyl futalosine synthase [Deltaproteobacteria bacterium]|nr:cyclic dehypoxanthinyl futalosine synthase [Deltaproteobacteria bacterium]
MPSKQAYYVMQDRITTDEALQLAREADFLTLGKRARDVALQKNGQRAAYLIDRNINYTNVCTARCNFCAFYRPKVAHPESYTLNFNEIDDKIRETIALGGKRILMQGGLHPDHTIEFYEELTSHIKKNHPIHIHAFSPPEIHHVSKKAGISYTEALRRLKIAGLQSMPGGGAEILVDRIRGQLMTGKCTTQEWLDVMQACHENGIRTTSTMMLGHIETWEDRIEHLSRLRDLQDKTGGFLSFIPWTFQPEHTPLHPSIKRNANVKLATPYEYLRFLAVSRIFLDNFDHIQVSLLTQGIKIAQIGLQFGADDLGSLLIEENVVRSAGCDQEFETINQLPAEIEKMRGVIREAGLTPYERDTFYQPI